MATVRTKEEEKEIVRRALAMLRPRGLAEEAQDGERESGQVVTRLEVETLAASILPESKEDEVNRILNVWKNIFGINLDETRVIRHLTGLREWQSRRLR